ncbi:MAG: hypothetical protein WCT41_02035 [Candidatus Paceibacterota bacterium]|jgi:hypothetical protein
MNMNQMGEAEHNGTTEAARQRAIEHAAFIEPRTAEKDSSLARQEAIQAEVSKLNAELKAGVESASKQNDAAAIQLGIDLRNATLEQLKKLRAEYAELGERVRELGGEPAELIEDEESLDFTTVQ